MTCSGQSPRSSCICHTEGGITKIACGFPCSGGKGGSGGEEGWRVFICFALLKGGWRNWMTGKVYLGLDVGSTTAKLTLASADGRVLEARYQRHGAAARQTLASMPAAACVLISGIACFRRHYGIGLPWVVRSSWTAVCAGGHGRLESHHHACARDGRRGRTGWRRRQNPVSQSGHGSCA